jgi:hypothetical protein
VIGWGCTGSGEGPSKVPVTTTDAGPSAIASLSFTVAPGLACANGQGICVAPSQVVTFGVQGLSGTVVSLSLEGDYADAALTTQAVTLANDPVSVTLESASTTATFSIVARVGGAGSTQSVSLPVTVATSGTATIDALPSYAGLRPTPEFYATDFVLSTCAELTANPPDAGAAAWTSGPPGVAIALSVPAGERVAVDVRIGHYAFGCADVDPLVPQAMSTLPVQVYDIPMALALTNLNATFSYAPDDALWQSIAQAAVARIEAAFFATSSPGPALLDAIRAVIAVPADQAQFDSLRASEGWDATATSWLSSHSPSLASRAATWLTAATGVGLGPLVVTIGNGTAAGTAPVVVASFAGVGWASAGIVQPAPFQWTADANDTIHLSGTIVLSSTPLLAHEADLKAAAVDAGATDVPGTLALGIDCAGLASTLVGSGVSYPGCGAACTANLCGAALEAAWASAAAPAAGGADVVQTAITASAPTEVGDLAEPAYVSGGWLGSVSGPGAPVVDAGASTTISGSLLATEPAPP